MKKDRHVTSGRQRRDEKILVRLSGHPGDEGGRRPWFRDVTDDAGIEQGKCYLETDSLGLGRMDVEVRSTVPLAV